MKNYQATLFSFDGDKVSDFKNKESVSDVWNEISEMGSRWIFYPIPFVSTEKTIIDAPEGLEFLKGKRIKTAQTFLKNQWAERADEICEMFNAGMPLTLIY